MLLTETQSATAVGGISVALGLGAAIAPAKVGKLLGAKLVTGQDRYLGRQLGIDLAALGAVLLTAGDRRKGPLQNVVVSTTVTTGITVAAMVKGDIPRAYGIPMLVAGTALGVAALLPLIRN